MYFTGDESDWQHVYLLAYFRSQPITATKYTTAILSVNLSTCLSVTIMHCVEKA